MSTPQQRLLQLALDYHVLRFGEFTLKSGRQSPYFFNAGLFNTGNALKVLGECYADIIQQENLPLDMLFGPAYKGIPLVSAAAVALAERGKDYPYAFNRKEAKDHGEGGVFVGAPIQGNVLLVDDVITAGTAIRESVGLIQAAGAQVSGIVVLFDREERMSDAPTSTLNMLSSSLNVPVRALASFSDVLALIENHIDFADYMPAMLQYRESYGV
ncbi:MAG: orotate phosphoribosyltransferase [Gammaproteobacteria bacterium]